jgi:hypothetical protein
MEGKLMGHDVEFIIDLPPKRTRDWLSMLLAWQAKSFSDRGLDVIYTKVARIISDTEVILAASSDNGVQEGTEFVIFALGDPIFDPETGEPLGELELVKGRVVVTHVMGKMSMAQVKPRQVTRRIPTMFEAMRPPIGGHDVTETVTDRLQVEGATAVQVDPTVRVGDKARSVE